MKSESCEKNLSYYIRLFSQRTSIRGIPKVENSKLLSIRWFWVIFIFCAHVLMISLCVLLIMRYFRFDTTMKISNSRVTFREFPEITICSKRFFDIGTTELPNPFVYLDDYSMKILARVADLIENNNIERAIQIIKNQYTTSSFFHDYFSFIQQRTISMVDSLVSSCNISSLDGRFSKNKVLPCKIKAVYNPLYLNCLAYSMPQSLSINKSSKFQMEITLNLAQKPKGSVTETFKMDEYVSDNADDDGFSENRIYITSVSDYPFDFDFDVPFSCQYFNHYVVERSQEQFYFTSSPTATCRNNELTANSFGVSFTYSRESLCNSLMIQRYVYERCQCYMDSLPNNETLYMVSNLCISNDTLYQCAEDVINSSQDLMTTLCLPSCTKTEYSVIYKFKPFYSSKFSEVMDELLYQAEDCKEIPECMNNAYCILRQLFQTFSNASCITENPVRRKRSVADLVTESVQNTPSSTSTLTSVPVEESCDKISLKVELRPKMQIQKESLVVEVNTLLSQTGGLCAFITGLTFTFIAEVMETLIFWISDILTKRKISE